MVGGGVFSLTESVVHVLLPLVFGRLRGGIGLVKKAEEKAFLLQVRF